MKRFILSGMAVSILLFIFMTVGCVNKTNTVPKDYLEIHDISAFVDILEKNPNGVLANRNGEKLRTQILTFQFVDGNKAYFCTNGKKPLYTQMLHYPYVSFCTNGEEYEPVVSLNGKVVFVEDAAIKTRAFEGSANVKRFYQTVDNPDFKVFYIDVEEVETFGSDGAKVYIVK